MSNGNSLVRRGQLDFALIKQTVGMVIMLRELRIPVRGNSASCPFHEDTRFSMSIQIRTNRVQCMAGCHARPIDIIELVQRTQNLRTEKDAAFWITQRFGLAPSATPATEQRIPRLPDRAIPAFLVDDGYLRTLRDKEYRIATTLLRFQRDNDCINLSYEGIMTYSGVGSKKTISKALKRFEADGWLSKWNNPASRECGYYKVTLGSTTFQELLANLRQAIEQRVDEGRKKAAARAQISDPDFPDAFDADFSFDQEEEPSFPDIDSYYFNQPANQPPRSNTPFPLGERVSPDLVPSGGTSEVELQMEEVVRRRITVKRTVREPSAS